MHSLYNSSVRRNSISTALLDSSSWPINFSSSIPLVRTGDGDEAFWKGLLALDRSNAWIEEQQDLDNTKLLDKNTTEEHFFGHTGSSCSLTEPSLHSFSMDELQSSSLDDFIKDPIAIEELALPNDSQIITGQSDLSSLDYLVQQNSKVFTENSCDFSSTVPESAAESLPSQSSLEHSHPLPKSQRRKSSKRKRQRSAPISELSFDHMVDPNDSRFWRIRAWKNERGMLFYDCVCGKRKAVQDLNKIKKHCERHSDGCSRKKSCGSAETV